MKAARKNNEITQENQSNMPGKVIKWLRKTMKAARKKQCSLLFLAHFIIFPSSFNTFPGSFPGSFHEFSCLLSLLFLAYFIIFLAYFIIFPGSFHEFSWLLSLFLLSHLLLFLAYFMSFPHWFHCFSNNKETTAKCWQFT